jgi:hypothetical protein
MQKRINNYLNRPFLLFLSYRPGRIYYIGLIIFFAFFLNVFQPFGLTNWHAFHKSLFLTGYSLVYIGTYGVVYIVYSLLRPAYFCRESWTIRRELHILSIYIPLAALFSWIFTDVYVAEIDFSLSVFLALQFYNGIISIGVILTFGYFVSTKLRPDEQLSPVTLRASEGMINCNNTVDVTDEALEDMINYNNAVDVTEPPTEVLPSSPEPTGYIIIKREKIDVSTILFASSDRNTISIYILQRGNVRVLTKIMTLKAFADLVDAYPYMKSCSVSFIVNINQIELWSDTSSKMTLYMKGCNLTVPVTKGSIPCFKDIMNELGMMKKQ